MPKTAKERTIRCTESRHAPIREAMLHVHDMLRGKTAGESCTTQRENLVQLGVRRAVGFENYLCGFSRW